MNSFVANIIAKGSEPFQELLKEIKDSYSVLEAPSAGSISAIRVASQNLRVIKYFISSYE